VIVTDGDAESAAAAVSAATSAAIVSSTTLRLIFLPPWVGAEKNGAVIPRKSNDSNQKDSLLFD
jgi:hypothetical protein